MDDTPIATKLVNALIPAADAKVGLYAKILQALGPALGQDQLQTIASEAILTATLERFRAFYGGLWVGGSVALTSSFLTFTPNAMNVATHSGDMAFSIPLCDIVDLTLERGGVTDLVVIATRNGSVKIRCWRALRFLETILQARDAARH